MKIIKRDGSEAEYDINKIITAIRKANNEVQDMYKLSDNNIAAIADSIDLKLKYNEIEKAVEPIQDAVELEIMNAGAYKVAQHYIKYRTNRAAVRQQNTTDAQILSLLENNNESIKQENSNKNPIINSTQRDYMAGEVSKDISRRFIIPERIWDAHELGIIHFHKLIVA